MEESVEVYIPVSISYPALESVLKNQLVGQYLPKTDEGVDIAPYVQLLDIGISGSSAAANEVILRIKLRVLRTVMKRDEVDLYTLATLGYDNVTQQLYVKQFHLNSRTSSGFYNTALEVMVNKVAYHQIIRKARVNLKDIIAEELSKANGLLGEGVDIKGVKLMGAVNEFRVQNVMSLPNKVTLSVELTGNIEANVWDLSNFLPATE